MKKYIPFFCLLILTFSACKKSDSFDPAKQAIADDGEIQAYLTTNNITGATKDASGLYYKVITPGTGNYPTISSTITVNSTGKLLDGTLFDTENALVTPLTNVIRGWQIGVPHINTGGRLLLIVPSALGYGNAAAGTIPKNSVLVFTIDLLGYSN
ncbi:FKBP-type peptidyl-prolyl cis-trans isomerase [Mucilaginibacter sp.]|jgi:FKBP-type peptidyl-prolyl cis-trans isomerase|uniref:FKBP-type peptidyl-prolyl cis-trans isomerase n=1 Tax=Mucilaginibacter sp. TaxID=1882438 RepID=UPI002BC43792|nr:FKBP-type peptidyl-prolyl cis-trans isomerase [Mucilaginibacter sp.]HTI60485.1 FKBP-type peptidyl-prolyl cis-trans isomerase [Mucilaginibacter sp.]